MRTVEEIVEEVRHLSPQDRRRLIRAVENLGRDKPSATEAARLAALDAFLALAGTADTEQADVSSDKYKHLAVIYGL
jgi:hypothetical protein